MCTELLVLKDQYQDEKNLKAGIRNPDKRYIVLWVELFLELIFWTFRNFKVFFKDFQNIKKFSFFQNYPLPYFSFSGLGRTLFVDLLDVLLRIKESRKSTKLVT